MSRVTGLFEKKIAWLVWSAGPKRGVSRACTYCPLPSNQSAYYRRVRERHACEPAPRLVAALLRVVLVALLWKHIPGYVFFVGLLSDVVAL